MFRRKTMPPELAPAWGAFLAQAERVQQAREALLSCLPVGRVDPAPVPVGLDLLRDELDAVDAEMDAWRQPEVEPQWAACRAAMAEARAAIPTARRVAASTGELEELLGAVADVHEPLDAWRVAEQTWRGLRVRARNGPGGIAPGAVS